jgi:hypothetical protein
MGREVVVAVTGGKLDFGPWEQIFYGEFDGKRRKRVLVKIIGEKKNPGIMTGVFYAGSPNPQTSICNMSHGQGGIDRKNKILTAFTRNSPSLMPLSLRASSTCGVILINCLL